MILKALTETINDIRVALGSVLIFKANVMLKQVKDWEDEQRGWAISHGRDPEKYLATLYDTMTGAGVKECEALAILLQEIGKALSK